MENDISNSSSNGDKITALNIAGGKQMVLEDTAGFLESVLLPLLPLETFLTQNCFLRLCSFVDSCFTFSSSSLCHHHEDCNVTIAAMSGKKGAAALATSGWYRVANLKVGLKSPGISLNFQENAESSPRHFNWTSRNPILHLIEGKGISKNFQSEVVMVG